MNTSSLHQIVLLQLRRLAEGRRRHQAQFQKVTCKRFYRIVADCHGDVGDTPVSGKQQFSSAVDSDKIQEILVAAFDLVEKNPVQLLGCQMETISDGFGRQRLHIVSVDVVDDFIRSLCFFDLADIVGILIRLSIIAGFHTDPGHEYLADVRTVYEPEDFCKLLHRKVCVQQEIDRLSNPHFVD